MPGRNHLTGTAADDALLRSVASVVARQVEGVSCMGEGLLQDFNCKNGACSDTGHGVVVNRWGEDIFLHIHLCCAEGTDTQKLKKEIQARVRITLDNLLFIHPAAIEIQVDVPARQAGEAEAATQTA